MTSKARKSRTRKTLRSPSRKASAVSAPASSSAPDRAAEVKQRRELALVGPFKPRPGHFRYLRAYSELLEEGAAVTYSAIAKRMGISRVNLWKMRLKWTGLDAWVSEQLCAGNADLVGPVVRRMAMMGLRGSRECAELFLKHAGGVLGREGGGGEVHVHTGPAIINIAVPRPGDAPVSASLETMKR